MRRRARSPCAWPRGPGNPGPSAPGEGSLSGSRPASLPPQAGAGAARPAARPTRYTVNARPKQIANSRRCCNRITRIWLTGPGLRPDPVRSSTCACSLALRSASRLHATAFAVLLGVSHTSASHHHTIHVHCSYLRPRRPPASPRAPRPSPSSPSPHRLTQWTRHYCNRLSNRPTPTTLSRLRPPTPPLRRPTRLRQMDHRPPKIALAATRLPPQPRTMTAMLLTLVGTE